jgi:hypothetical protein
MSSKRGTWPLYAYRTYTELKHGTALTKERHVASVCIQNVLDSEIDRERETTD